MISSKVRKAVHDLRYLLDRDYPRSPAVKFVSNHYQLELDNRHLLARCVFSKRESADHRKKSVDVSWIWGQKLAVDGYNVLITLESILRGKTVVRCDDGFIRDLRAIFGKYKMSEATEETLEKFLQTIAGARPKKAVLFFDKQVSKSGELAGMARDKMNELGINGDARTAVGTDAEVRVFDVAASSDRGIIESAKAVWDIPADILAREEAEVLDLTKI